MSNFNEFQRAAKAAIRVALQWFFLAIPTGLICGLVGTLFHLSVERVTELRADQPWLLFLLPAAGLLITALYKATKCEGVGTNNVIRAVQSGEPVSILLVPAIFLGTVLTHLCGGSAGRQGAASAGTWAPCSISRITTAAPLPSAAWPPFSRPCSAPPSPLPSSP